MIPFNLGIRAHDVPADTCEELTKKIKKHGLSHIQFAPQKSFPELVPAIQKSSLGTAAYFHKQFQRSELDLSILGCYVNISSQDPATREKALADFNHQLSLASTYQAAMVATETGSVEKGYTKKNFTEEAYQTARDSVIRMVQQAEKFGATVAIEAGMNHPLYTYQLAKRLVDEVQSPNLKIIIDCANLLNMENQDQHTHLIQQALETLDDHIAAIHLKDYQVKENKITFVPVGTGSMDFRPLLHYLKSRPLLFAALEATPESFVPQAQAHLLSLYEQC